MFPEKLSLWQAIDRNLAGCPLDTPEDRQAEEIARVRREETAAEWRMLKVGELVQDGDQFLSRAGQWKYTRAKGLRVLSGDNRFRRRVSGPGVQLAVEPQAGAPDGDPNPINETEAELLQQLEKARSERDTYHDRLEGLDADALLMHLELGLPEFDAGQVAGEIAGGMARVMRDEIQDLRQAVVNNKAASSSVAAELKQVRKERDTVHAAAMAAGTVVPPSPATRPGEATTAVANTHRVTLELTGRFDCPPAEWPWEAIFAHDVRVQLDPGESVRVVEEPVRTYFPTFTAQDVAKILSDALADVKVCQDAHTKALGERNEAQAERDKAIRERDKLLGEITSVLDRSEFASTELTRLRNRVAELESQLESVACRAATAETALESAPAASEWRILGPDEPPQIDDQFEGSDGQWCIVYPANIHLCTLPHRYKYRRRVTAPAASELPPPAAFLDARHDPIAPTSGERIRAKKLSPAASGAAAWEYSVRTDHGMGRGVTLVPPSTIAWAEIHNADPASCVPLYAAPQPAPGWLTKKDREWLTYLLQNVPISFAADEWIHSVLARSSPPEVVLEDFTQDAVRNLDAKYLAGWDQCMALAKRAISAAGVTVKEVG